MATDPSLPPIPANTTEPRPEQTPTSAAATSASPPPSASASAPQSPTAPPGRRRRRRLHALNSEYVVVEVAAQRLDIEPRALRARCRRAAVRVGTIVQADLGGGVIAIKLGHSWRVRLPKP